MTNTHSLSRWKERGSVREIVDVNNKSTEKMCYWMLHNKIHRARRKKERSATLKGRGEWQMKLYKRRTKLRCYFYLCALLCRWAGSINCDAWLCTMISMILFINDSNRVWACVPGCSNTTQYDEFRGNGWLSHTNVFRIQKRQTKEINMIWPLENSNANFHFSSV